MTNIMLDIETFGSGNNAAISWIGAVKFDEDKILGKFKQAVDLASCKPYGLDIDAGTVVWWLDKEREEAREAWLAAEKIELIYALEGFSMWARDGADDDPAVWGNGATFDNVIVRNACAKTGIPYPTPFWMDRCYRTVKNLAPEIKLKRFGTHHDPADDAETQAVHLQTICRQLGIKL